MRIEEAEKVLQREGYRCDSTEIAKLVFCGRISKPQFTTSNQLDFQPEHLDALRLLLPGAPRLTRQGATD